MNGSVDPEPMPDYRYFKFRLVSKHLIESLVNSSLYFARPNALNDPFDCTLDLDRSLSRAALSATGKRKVWLERVLETPFARDWKSHVENIGICSFSLDLHQSLLWSHYADQHYGLCLLYRFPESFLLDPKNDVIGVAKVEYADDALTDWLRTSAPLEMGQFVTELIKVYLTAKSPAWKYENEARIIRTEHGLFNIPFGFLEQVCFGLRTPQSDIDLITKLAAEYSGCKKFCRIIRGDSDFGLTAVEM